MGLPAAPPQESPSHFNGRDAIGHVAETQVTGMIARSEAHAMEAPGPLAAAYDAAREGSLVFLLLWAGSLWLNWSFSEVFLYFVAFGLGMVIWKMGRSAWLGWLRLERLHRLLEQERWEIEHHRQQEREELLALYSAKGFEGKLLNDVVDVLMADGDRLLRVMIEEEMGLSLENQEHPLKQGMGAGIGAFLAASVALLGLWLSPVWGLPAAALLFLCFASALLARCEGNEIIPAVIWNLGLGILSTAAVYLALQLLLTLFGQP